MGAVLATGGWMLQHAWQMRTDPLTFLVGCAAELGDVVEFPIPRQRVLFVNDPDAALRVLQGNHRAYGKRTIQYDALSLVTGEGLLTSDGAVWRRSRRLVQPAFHPRTLDAVGGHVAAAGERLLADWRARPAGTVVDVDDAMMRVALEVVGAALFSTDLGPQSRRLVHAVLEALDVVVARARSPLPLPLAVPTPGHRRLRAAVATLDATVADLVARRRAAGAGADADLLGLLLAARDGSDALSDRQVRDEVVTLVVAGHETVASALTWTWWLVSGAPEVAARLAEESDRVLAGRAPTAADYPALRYARAVFDEALRLYPPAWVITRRALEADELAGAEVPAGALVILSTYALHRHPAVWTNPERFDPERFTDGAAVRRAYLPFGAGPRLCVGRDFALLEGTLLLAQVSGAYRLERLPGQRVRPEALVTIRPRGGLPLRLVHRHL
jgi:cytochrome P450